MSISHCKIVHFYIQITNFIKFLTFIIGFIPFWLYRFRTVKRLCGKMQKHRYKIGAFDVFRYVLICSCRFLIVLTTYFSLVYSDFSFTAIQISHS